MLYLLLCRLIMVIILNSWINKMTSDICTGKCWTSCQLRGTVEIFPQGLRIAWRQKTNKSFEQLQQILFLHCLALFRILETSLRILALRSRVNWGQGGGRSGRDARGTLNFFPSKIRLSVLIIHCCSLFILISQILSHSETPFPTVRYLKRSTYLFTSYYKAHKETSQWP